MTPDADTLQTELRTRGLWRDDAPGAGADRSPWAIRVLLGAAAWLAACLFLPLIGILFADVIELTAWHGFVVGGACCLVAVPMLRSMGDFLRQLGSALSLAGLILAGIPAVSADAPGWMGLGILAGAMYGVASEPVHRFLCASMIAVALVLAIDHPFEFALSGVPPVVLAATALFIWAAQLPVAAHPRWQALEPMAWAFFLAGAALAMIVSDTWLQEGLRSPAAFRDRFATALCALAPAIVWWHAGRQVSAHDSRSWSVPRVIGCLALLALAPVWIAIPGAALALCAVVLGFALFRVLLLGAGVVALLAHLAAYYYQTHTTLLQKSLGLFLAGAGLVCVALLVAWWQRRSQ